MQQNSIYKIVFTKRDLGIEIYMLYAGRVITTDGEIYKTSSDPVGLLGAVRFVYKRSHKLYVI